MKRLILTTLLASLGALALYGQNRLLPADEQHRLSLLPSDQVRCDTLNEWAFQRNGAASLPYAQAALALAAKIGYTSGRADAFIRLGQAAAHAGNYTEAEAYYRRSLALREAGHDLPGVASCYNLLGVLQKKRGNYQAALDLYHQGLARMEGQPPHINAAVLHNNAGTACRYLSRYDEALEEFSHCIAIYARLREAPTANRTEISIGIASLRMNLGIMLQENLNQYSAAHDSLEKSRADFEIYQRPDYLAKCYLLLGNNAYYRDENEEAMQNYDRALALKDHLSADDQAIVQKNRGRIYISQKSYSQAMSSFQTALDTFLRTENQRETAATYYEIGNLHYENDASEPAVEAYKKALAYDPQDAILKSHLLYFLPNALDQLGRHEEAASYSTQYIELLSSLDSVQTQSAFEEMMEFQLVKDRLEKRLIKQEQQTQLVRMQAGFGGLGLLLLAVGLLAFIYWQKKRLAEKTTKIITQEKLELLRNLELETYSAWLEGQETTQQKIGKDLHDGLGSLLSTVKLHFASVENRLDQLQAENRGQYETANRLLDDACQEVRRISHELASALLMKFGLKVQLEALADAIRSSGKMEVELATFGLEERLDNKLEINIYRMIQILTHNVIEHARARTITISVNRFDQLLNVMVEDDGQGFRPEDLRNKPGLGMKSLTARVHDLDGELHIDSQPGQGARVSIDLPLINTYAQSLALNN